MEKNILISQDHLNHLYSSAIIDEIIIARGYKTIIDENELRNLGFSAGQCRVPGLLLPLWTTDGQNGTYVYRPDNPRVVENMKKTNPDGTHPNTVIKYELPKGIGVRLDCPPIGQPMLADPSIPLWITEGQKKADALASAGLCAIALLGVWNFVGKNELGGVTFLADWQHVALNGRPIRLIFDSDVLVKPSVRQALERLTEHLHRKGATVNVVYLPHQNNGSKIGVDDWLAAGHTVEELEKLVESPRPAPKVAEPIVELLDSAPTNISKPLSLLNDHAYVATWVYAKTTQTETLNRSGEIIRHDPPIMTTERVIIIIRDDGKVFGGGRNQSLEELGLEIHLSEVPPPGKLWASQAVKNYSAGNRPSPIEVFTHITNVVGHFIDFDRSLADQRTMSETVACYILSTWLLDAFNVIGFLWPNGDRGSGKTNLLTVISELAYLGQLILAGGSFASLRDLADYGATLAFDDAENLSDPRKTDPDKRALLLAGNRRGVKVPVKELGPDKAWHTRYVNAFCPRLFSAIRLPDPVLASRTIVIPLIRTTDRTRANVDPLDYSAWPFDHDELLNSLWSLGLANLKELPKFDDLVAKKSSLSGRALQPWRAILAVAAWLDEKGISGLWERIEKLAVSYQNERPDFEASDMTSLVIRALMQCVVAKVTEVTNVANAKMPSEWHFTNAELTEICKRLAEETDGEINSEHITSQRIGHVLQKMRLTKPPRPRGQKSRIWSIKRDELIKSADSYGILVPEVIRAEIVTSAVEIGDIGDIGNIGYIDGAPTGSEINLSKGAL
jgi:hypothetical protein